MAIMNPSKLRDVLEALPYSSFRESKQQAIRAIITKYLNGEIATVVRCKDCKYEEDCMKQQTLWRRNPVLELNEYEYKKVDFCSAGERKNND